MVTKMIDYVSAWQTAIRFYNLTRRSVKFNKKTALKELDSFGLFTPLEAARFVGCSPAVAEKYLTVTVNSKRTWPLTASIALSALANAHEEWGEESPNIALLVRASLREGASVLAVSELTGVNIDIVREAVIAR